jgi:dTMP kinase
MFITFEGGEGSGKTTQIKLVRAYLEGAGKTVLVTREPGGTPLGDALRALLLDPRGPVICDEAEALLFATSRAQLVREVIRPALERGEIVLCDRFVHSSIAYQGVARGLGWKEVYEANRMAVGDTWPDLTIWLDIDPAEGLKRAGKRAIFDRIEREEIAFHERIREGFQQCEKGWKSFVRVDASGSVEDVCGAILDEITSRGATIPTP